MTYSESAEGQKISRKRALLELKAHGMGQLDVEQFDEDMGGERETYDALEVLRWLGY